MIEFGIQQIYDNARASLGLDEVYFFMLMSFCAHTIPFFVLNAILHIMWNSGLCKGSLVEPTAAYPDKDLVRHCIAHVVALHTFILPPLSYINYYVATLTDPGYIHGPLPDAFTFAWQFGAAALIEDTLFYWTHRGLHHPSVYKYVHKQHHNFKRTIGFASEYAHPAEFVISNLIPTIAGPAILRMHALAASAWIFYRVCETVDAHCGYRFWWSPFNIVLRIQGGVERHDFHHSHNVGSYGSQTKFWDWMMGTDKHFKEYLIRKATQRKNE